MECPADHFLIWQKSDEVNDGHVSPFTKKPELDYSRLNYFRNLMDAAKLWPIDVTEARTINPIANTSMPGQWTDSSKFVCGYFIIKGNVDHAVKLSGQIDRSFAEPFMRTLKGEALDDFTAHATGTYAAIAGVDASVMMVWANNYAGEPRMPSDLAIGAVTAYNAWGRQLLDDGALLDAGRMNVRRDTVHLIRDKVVDGPYGGGRLLAIGSYSRSNRSPVDAIRASALLQNDSSLVVGLQRCNGWCSAYSREPVAYDNPKNSIFV